MNNKQLKLMISEFFDCDKSAIENNMASWIAYRILIDLCGLTETNPDVIKAKNEMLRDSAIVQILEELKNWPGKVLSSHKSAGQIG